MWRTINNLRIDSRSEKIDIDSAMELYYKERKIREETSRHVDDVLENDF